MKSSGPVVVLFNNDLRVRDHAALAAAAEGGNPVIPLFMLDDAMAGEWVRGSASRWWLHESLTALSLSLAALGAPLVLRQGNTRSVVIDILRETGADAVYLSRGFEPWSEAFEHDLRTALRDEGASLKRFAGTLLHDPHELKTQAGGPFRVYTPFWRALTRAGVRRVQASPKRLIPVAVPLASDDLAAWRLQPTKPDWATGLRETWTPGEAGARARLGQFLDDAVMTYGTDRDRPGTEGTSRLSPHLHFGEISPATCWHAALASGERDPARQQGVETFAKELAWREFSYHLLTHWPTLPAKPFRVEFQNFPWAERAGDIERWQHGMTGFPIVDAGMRELWATGWMHNRVRMITASFLIKDLLIPWTKGEAWFWDCLVDADLASNAASWQWVAGSGADAAPYFRIFNPVTQSRKFDPDGVYVRRWVPEIAGLDSAHIHAPWEAPVPALVSAGVTLGKTYPAPMVDHARARGAALAAYAAIRSA